MRVRIEFEAPTPMSAFKVVRNLAQMVQQWLMYNHNPGEWKRSEVVHFRVATDEKDFSVTLRLDE